MAPEQEKRVIHPLAP